jgi:hypothetical protein
MGPHLETTTSFQGAGRVFKHSCQKGTSRVIDSILFLIKLFSQDNEKAKDKGLVALNEAAVLSEIERLGSGLVKDITVHV